MNRPFLLESIEELLETALLTACVKNAIPISLILVSDSGVAKSKLLMRLKGEGIHHTDSFSSQGLFELTQADRKNEIKFLVAPDMNPTLSRKPTTVQSTISNLLSLTADGTCRIDDGRKEKIAEHTPLGLISACTPQIYEKQAKKWFALGLRRRIVPIFYAYTQETQDKLMEMARNGKISAANFEPLKFTFTTPVLPVISDATGRMIEAKSLAFANNLGKLAFRDDQKIKRWSIAKVIPISPFVTLQALARAHALRSKRMQVNDEDMEFLARFLSFTDPEMPKQL